MPTKHQTDQTSSYSILCFYSVIIILTHTQDYSRIDATSAQAGSAASSAANSKIAKYADLSATHVFMPVAIDAAGSWNQQAIDATEDIGRRISVITQEPLETIHLFQRISVAIQATAWQCDLLHEHVW